MRQTSLLKNTTLPRQSFARRDLLVSLIFLALIFAFVLGVLALDANWRKFLRVLIAASTYLCVLLTRLKVRGKVITASGGIPFWAFAVAAAAAELSSGWLRAGASVGVSLWVSLAAALLIGGVHWLGLRVWRPLRECFLRRTSTKAHRAA